MIGKSDGGLYILSSNIDKVELLLTTNHSSNTTQTTENLDIFLVHQRLGHVYSSVLQMLLNHS